MPLDGSYEAIAFLVVLLSIGGLVAGFVAGLFGIGGGGIMVPILYEAFGLAGVDSDVRMHLAVGTSLAVMIPTTVSSFRSHLRRGNVEVAFIKRLMLPVACGVVIGSIIAKSSGGSVLQWIWITVAVLIAVRQFVGSRLLLLGETIPKSRLLEAWGLIIGVISTLMSIGGGAFIITTLALYGRSMQQAVGTSSGFGPIVALPGVIGFMWAGWGAANVPPLSIGYVNLIAAACMIPAAVLAAPIGARVASAINKRALEIGYGVFMVLVAIRFALALL